ncbi:histone H3-K9 methyltransferase KMT1 [Chytridiales sp. JEL 0842]|nr:histone H3-K9 methyltransferase KMT1 [Chytridiales sp. JEL 0842]
MIPKSPFGFLGKDTTTSSSSKKTPTTSPPSSFYGASGEILHKQRRVESLNARPSSETQDKAGSNGVGLNKKVGVPIRLPPTTRRETSPPASSSSRSRQASTTGKVHSSFVGKSKGHSLEFEGSSSSSSSLTTNTRNGKRKATEESIQVDDDDDDDFQSAEEVIRNVGTRSTSKTPTLSTSSFFKREKVSSTSANPKLASLRDSITRTIPSKDFMGNSDSKKKESTTTTYASRMSTRNQKAEETHHILSDKDDDEEEEVPLQKKSKPFKFYKDGNIDKVLTPPWTIHLFCKLLDCIGGVGDTQMELLRKLAKDLRCERWCERRRVRRNDSIAAMKMTKSVAIPGDLVDEDKQLIKSYQQFKFHPALPLAVSAIMYRHPVKVLRYWIEEKKDILEIQSISDFIHPPTSTALYTSVSLNAHIQHYVEASENITNVINSNYRLSQFIEKLMGGEEGCSGLERLWTPVDEDMDLKQVGYVPFEVDQAKFELPEREYVTVNKYSRFAEHLKPDPDEQFVGCQCASNGKTTCYSYDLCECLQAMKGYAYECDALRDFIEHRVLECMPWCHCSAPSCKNRLISDGLEGVQRSIVVKPTKTKGWGVFATEDIYYGQFIGEVVGEVITPDTYQKRKQLYQDCSERDIMFGVLDDNSFGIM